MTTREPSPLIRLAAYARPHRRRVVLASTRSIINKAFDIMPEILIGVAVDVVVNKQASFLAGLGLRDVMTQLMALGGLTLIIWALESVFEYLYQIQWRNLAQTLQHGLRLDAYAHVQRLDLHRCWQAGRAFWLEESPRWT